MAKLNQTERQTVAAAVATQLNGVYHQARQTLKNSPEWQQYIAQKRTEIPGLQQAIDLIPKYKQLREDMNALTLDWNRIEVLLNPSGGTHSLFSVYSTNPADKVASVEIELFNKFCQERLATVPNQQEIEQQLVLMGIAPAKQDSSFSIDDLIDGLVQKLTPSSLFRALLPAAADSTVPADAPTRQSVQKE